MNKTISYISPITWFSASRTKGKYATVSEALRAHLEYISRSKLKHNAEKIAIHNLDPDRWVKFCNDALSRNSRARVAAKFTFALPNSLKKAENGVELIKEFFTQQQLFKTQKWDPGQKKNISHPIMLHPEDIGIAVHDSEGVTAQRNLHAHIVLSARPRAGGSLKIDKAELKKLHKKWRKFLESRGFEVIMNADQAVKQYHVGPARLRNRKKEVREEAMRELEALRESYQALQRAREEEEKYLEEVEEARKRQRMQFEYEQRIKNMNAVAMRLASRIRNDLFGIIALVVLLVILSRQRALKKECERFKKQVEERIKALNSQFNQAAAKGELKDARDVVKEMVRLKNRVARERKELETELAKAIPTPQIAKALGIEISNLKIKQENGRWLWFDPSSGRGGSNIDLVMQAKSLNFREAVEWILNSNNDYLEKLKEEAMKPLKIEQLSDSELAELKERYGLGPAGWTWSRAQFLRHPDGRIEPVWLKPRDKHITLHGGTEGEGVPARAIVVCDHPLHCTFLSATLPFPPYSVLGLSLNGVPITHGGELEEVLSKLISRGIVNKDTKVIIAVGDEGTSADLSRVFNTLDLNIWEDFSGWVNNSTHLDDFRARLMNRAELIQQAAQQAAAQGQEYVDQDGQPVEDEQLENWDFMPRPGR